MFKKSYTFFYEKESNNCWGGLSGLTTAYYLLKKGNFEVQIIEAKERLGGRLFTTKIEGKPVDAGGFMIFPFYKNFKKLLKDLKISNELKKINENEFFKFGDNDWISDKDLPYLKMVPFRFILRYWKDIFFNKMSIYEPDLNLFEGKNMYQALIDSNEKKEKIDILESLSISYTYPSLKKTPACVIVPALKKLFMNGLFNRCRCLNKGTVYLVEILHKNIVKNGGKILLSENVSEVKNNLIKLESGKNIEFDELVITSELLAGKVLDGVEVDDSEYTHYDGVAMRMDKVPAINGVDKWFVSYLLPEKNKKGDVFFSTISQLSSYTDLDDKYLGGFIKLVDGENVDSIQYIKEMAIEKIEKLFPGNKVLDVVSYHRWRLTMPCLDLKDIKIINKENGKNNIWFAGDYLGFSSMETAVYSGKKIANNILNQ